MFFKVQINPVWNEIEFLLEVNTYLRFLQVWDHPRLRGAYLLPSDLHFRSRGSPPLTRGILHFYLSHPSCFRITPAYAGHTRSEGSGHRRSQDHPRLRGAYFSIGNHFPVAVGSPPLTRGILEPSGGHPEWHRITPAYAGHTYSGSHKVELSGDHPRLRGAYSVFLRYVVFISGSPPLTRGILFEILEELLCTRITPAYAGHTCGVNFPKSPKRDHPRLRGAYSTTGTRT